MTKKINKPELAILNDVFVTVALQIFNFLIGSLNSDNGDGNENVNQFACLAGKMHVRFSLLSISFPSSGKKKQREIAKLEVL